MLTIRTFLSATLVAILAACATTGATYGSGVGDAMLASPPWYAGTRGEEVARDTSPIAHVEITFQRGASQPAAFDPATTIGSPVRALLLAMNAWLDSSGISTRIGESEEALNGVAPDVRFGCFTEAGMPANDCVERGDSALGRGRQYMQLSVGRPSSDWVKALNDAWVDSSTGRILVITLEVGQYLVRQEGLAGTKRVAIGTRHDVGLPWLTSLETPVMVLQLTGALVDRNGRAIRIGAEGFHVRRTSLPISALAAQELMGDDDVQAAMRSTRKDLTGQPLAWQAALQELVEQLTGRKSCR